MRIHSFFDAFSQGLKNIRRNKMFSFASICTIAACIFLLGMFYAIVVNVQHIVQNVEEQGASPPFSTRALPMKRSKT